MGGPGLLGKGGYPQGELGWTGERAGQVQPKGCAAAVAWLGRWQGSHRGTHGALGSRLVGAQGGQGSGGLASHC